MLIQRVCPRTLLYSTSSEVIIKKKLTTQTPIEKSVFFSNSKDIYTNLALEDWLYRNANFSKRNILMMWQNDPCVVIGRHQNPWTECNIPRLPQITTNGVSFARRNSGGGTVYHDEGNLNLTFFTSRERYNRKENLELIVKAVKKGFGIDAYINSREDICIDECKISGTASKIGRNIAYHHCTLLVDANKENLRKALQKSDLDIQSNATKSVRSPIMNLSELSSLVNIPTLIEAIRDQYLGPLGGSYQIETLTPSEERYPGLYELLSHFESWQWRYGKTPKFSVTRTVMFDDKSEVKVVIDVSEGNVTDIKTVNNDVLVEHVLKNIKELVIGNNFSIEELHEIDSLILSSEFLKNNRESNEKNC